jgi:hypothetical protein
MMTILRKLWELFTPSLFDTRTPLDVLRPSWDAVLRLENDG